MAQCSVHGEKDPSFRFCPDCGAPLTDIEDGVERIHTDARASSDNIDGLSPDAQAQQRIEIGIEMIRVPAGEFLYGDVKERVFLPEYKIAKTPVTHKQYQAFVDATGHRMPRYWFGKFPSQKGDHPVVGLDRKDVQRFCEWLGLRLPTQREWEKAARGADGRDFPWGDQGPDATRCNFDGNVGHTTPVGQYPTGASPHGLLDMAGNVWELCLDADEHARQRNVFRGGSWLSDMNGIRTWSRGFGPDEGSDTAGFRCAGSS